MITEEEIETSWFTLQPGRDWSDVSYQTIETTCSSSDLLLKGQGGNVQIRNASESLLKGLLGGKAWLKWLLHVLWKLKPSIFAQSLDKSGWIWPCYFKAPIALLKIKENITASKQMDHRLQAIIGRYLSSQKPLILSQNCTLFLGTWKEQFIFLHRHLYLAPFLFRLQSQVSCH